MVKKEDRVLEFSNSNFFQLGHSVSDSSFSSVRERNNMALEQLHLFRMGQYIREGHSDNIRKVFCLFDILIP